MRSFRRDEGRAGVWIATALSLVVLAAVLAVGRVALRGPAPRNDGVRPAGSASPAPEFAGIVRWLNSEPLTLASLRGKVVLVDFWTYSCVNCVRTIPHLKALYERYRAFGLEIVGVHAPEFNFEHKEDNVRAAIGKYGVSWPVAMDNDMVTWHAYDNHYWPHVYLLDRAGRIRYDHIGEGDEGEQETQVRAILAEDGRSLPAPLSPDEPSFDPHITPEIYAGRERGQPAGTIANPQGYQGRSVVTYTAPSRDEIVTAPPSGRIYLAGPWAANEETLTAAGPARLYLPFNARTVFMVASWSPAGTVRLTLDGAPLGSRAAAGAPGGVVRVDRADLYALAELPKTERHVLELDVEKGFTLYTFTFG